MPMSVAFVFVSDGVDMDGGTDGVARAEERLVATGDVPAFDDSIDFSDVDWCSAFGGEGASAYVAADGAGTGVDMGAVGE